MHYLYLILIITFSINSFAENSQRGKTLFLGKCAICHGENGEGLKAEGPSLNNPDFLSIASDDYLATVIKNGRSHTQMHFGPRSEKQIIPNTGLLVSYIRSWEKKFKNYKKIKTDAGLVVTGDKNKGHNLYSRHCANCHASDASGYADGFNGKNIGLAIGFKDFLKQSPDDFIKKSIEMGRRGPPGLNMPAFTNKFDASKPNILKDQDINDIIVYLRSL